MTNEGLRAIAAETVEIVRAGWYTSASGTPVDISASVAEAVAGTRLYLPDEPGEPTGSLPGELPGSRSGSLPGSRSGELEPPVGGPAIEVTNESTLAAGRRLDDELGSAPGGVAGLVFASARKPGGGFLTGARAQEEDVARCSALHACLATVPEFYEYHRSRRDLAYSDRVIYAPGVPVFRDDSYRLLDRPYRMSMLVAAAPNLAAARTNQPDLLDRVGGLLRARALRVLSVAAAHRHPILVLGAWGCGVFGNEPAVVADAFAAGLRTVPPFDRIVFAVLDRASGTPTYRAFAGRFGAP